MFRPWLKTIADYRQTKWMEVSDEMESVIGSKMGVKRVDSTFQIIGLLPFLVDDPTHLHHQISTRQSRLRLYVIL